MNKNIKLEQRSIRIFISSTFRDMMPEREYLMKFIFPELRRKCKKKFVDITEIDLRWGIPAEDSQEGKVIEICLNEIDKSRPYFIGILGNRYGWTPSGDEYKKHAKVIEDFPWLENDIENGLSITEMEIQYGVLRNENMEGKAFFYLKNNDANSIEDPKLKKLKDKLKNQEQFPVNDYSSVEQLGTQILNQLWQQISVDFPDEKIPDEHNREKLDQQSFLQSHLNFFLDYSNYLDVLNKRLNENNRIVIYGESGIGKSALLSNWIAEKADNYSLINYFCGSTSDSTKVENLASYIASEIKNTFNITRAIPKTIEDPKNLLQTFFYDIESQEQVYIVIDGIDELLVEEKNLRLRWMPNEIPENIHIIVSTSDKEHLELLEKELYLPLTILPIPNSSVSDVSNKYFNYYSKKLSGELMNKVEAFSLANKPLVLYTLLNELRLFGTYEDLPIQIKYYTKNDTTSDFFQAFLQRLENDYPKDKFKLDSILSLLNISNKGLTETEIIEITGVSRLNWSLLYNILDYHLVNKNGVLKISNKFLQEAVEQRYLSKPDFKTQKQQELASYFFTIFQSLNNDKENEALPRLSEELPDILLSLKDDEKLKEVISFIPLFIYLFEKRNNDLAKYFGFIRKYHKLNEIFVQPLNEYIHSTTDDQQKIKASFYLGHSLLSHDNPENAIAFYYKSLEVFNQTKNKSHFVIDALKELSSIFNSLGEYKTSAYILENLLPYEGEEGIAEIFDLLSQLYMDTGELEKAETLTSDSLMYSVDRFGKNSLEVAVLYNNLGRIYDRQKNYKKGEENYLKALQITETLLGTSHSFYQKTISNLGILHMYNGNLDAALEIFTSVFEIRKSIFGLKHPSTFKTMNSLGVCKQLMGKYDEAYAILQETWGGQKEILGENHQSTLLTLGNIADLYLHQSKFDKAEQLQRSIYEKYGQLYGGINDQTINMGLALANCLQKQEKNDQADAQYKKMLNAQIQYYGENHSMVEYTKNKILELNKPTDEEITTLLEKQLKEAHQFMESEDYESAEEYFKQIIDTCNKMFDGNHPAYFGSVDALAELYFRWQKYGEAVAYCEKIELIAKEVQGDTSAKYIEYKTLRCYNCYKAGMNSSAWGMLHELSEFHEKLLEFDPGYIAKMYREMLNFYTNYQSVLENFEKNKDDANYIFQQAKELYDEAISNYSDSNVNETFDKLDKVQQLAQQLTKEFGQTFEHAYFAKAQILGGLGKPDESIKILIEGLQYITVWNYDFHPLTGMFAEKIGEILIEQEKIEEAFHYFTMAQKVNLLLEDYPNEGTINIHGALTQLLVRMNKESKAVKMIEETISIVKKLKGDDDELIQKLVGFKNQILNE